MKIDNIDTYLDDSSGFIDGYIRAESEADWVLGAIFYNVLIEDDGNLLPNVGVYLADIGLLKGKYHINIRISPDSPCNWREMGKAWTTFGIVDPEKNAEEVGLLLERVTLIDPTSIASPELRFS